MVATGSKTHRAAAATPHVESKEVSAKQSGISIAALPIHHILERLSGQISREIFAEQADTLVLRNTAHGRDMRRDNDALVVPQPTVRSPLEFTLIDVQRNTAEFAFFQSS